MGHHRAGPGTCSSASEKAIDDGDRHDSRAACLRGAEPLLRSTAVDYGKGTACRRRSMLTPTCELMQIVVLLRSMDEISSACQRMIAGTRGRQGRDLRRIRGPVAYHWHFGRRGQAGQDQNRERIHRSTCTVARSPTCPSAFRRWSPWKWPAPCMTWSSSRPATAAPTPAPRSGLDIACPRIRRAVAVRRHRGDPCLHLARRSRAGLALPVPRCSAWRTWTFRPSRSSTCGKARTIRFRPPKATADELGFRTPIIGSLFRHDGGEGAGPAA